VIRRKRGPANGDSSRVRVRCTHCAWGNDGPRVRDRDNACVASCRQCGHDVEVVREGEVPPRGLNERERKAAS
jgi:NAD-dependent SIR2 family protein deacetylase